MSETCCCTNGAAVKGELPEFICFFCEVDAHRLSGMATNGEHCKRHESQWAYEKIQQRRRQIIVHSILYYDFNENTIPDATYDKFGRELIQLQKDYPEVSEKVLYHREAFKKYTSSTGFDLPRDDPRDQATARWLLQRRDNNE